jgi:hypothetical protein
MPARSVTPHLRRALIATLLLALALTQTLGVIHRVLSGHMAPQQRVVASTAGVDAGAIQALFAGHHDEGDCKVFDQLAHADLAWGEAAVAVNLATGETPVLMHAAWQIASQAAGYLARGPPVHA